MVTIQDYIKTVEDKDPAALGALFSYNATYRDFCPEIAGMAKYYCHGREGIDMFFRNLFVFHKFSITDPQILSDTEALFVGVYGSFYMVAVATILEHDSEGKIRSINVRPA